MLVGKRALKLFYILLRTSPRTQTHTVHSLVFHEMMNVPARKAVNIQTLTFVATLKPMQQLPVPGGQSFTIKKKVREPDNKPDNASEEKDDDQRRNGRVG